MSHEPVIGAKLTVTVSAQVISDHTAGSLLSSCTLLAFKGKGKKYSSSQTASSLRELTCHMGTHSVTCHPAEVTYPPLPQPIKAGTQFSDPGGMQG